MKKIILLAFISFFAQAQNLEEIIAKNIEAIGGKEALAKTTSYIAETNTSVMGNEIPGKLSVSVGKGYKSEIEVMGSAAIQCYTNTIAWSTNPMAGGAVEVMAEEQRASLVGTMYVGGILEGYPTNGATIKYEGKEKIETGEAHKLIVTPKGGGATTFYIDVNSNLTVLTVAKGNIGGNDTEIKTTFSDYKKLSTGALIPYKIALDLGQFQLETTITKVESNVAIDEAIFKKPN